MLSRSRSGFLPQVALLVLGVSACAGSSDINTPAGTGGNQSGNPGSKFYDNFIDTWVGGNYNKLWIMKAGNANDKKVKWKNLE